MTDSTSPMENNFNKQAESPCLNRAARLLGAPLDIGGVYLRNRLIQAPMAGISGRAFRMQARRFGAGLVVTEMISSYGITYANRRTMEMLALHPGEHPVAVQLFGNRPEVMATAARAAEAAGADIIDINMGCPARKVIKTGAGAALMRDESLAAAIVKAMAEAVKIPVMAKIRAGFSSVTAPSLSVKLADAGAAAIAVHPRTTIQGWRGKADHGVTAKVADSVSVPVIASGDISSASQVLGLIESGCAAVMIARTALGNPWLFSDLLSGEPPHPRPPEVVIDEIYEFWRDVRREMGEQRGVRYMRKFYGWYLAPFPLDEEFKAGIRRAENVDVALEAVRVQLAERGTRA